MVPGTYCLSKLIFIATYINCDVKKKKSYLSFETWVKMIIKLMQMEKFM